MLFLWCIKMLSAHLLTDFVLQPKLWVESRTTYHWKSKYLYIHAGLTAFAAALFTGFSSWITLFVILISHFLIDLWKSYRPATLIYFFADQFLHLAVIAALGALLFPAEIPTAETVLSVVNSKPYWLVTLAVIFLSYPSGIMIGMLTSKWRNQIPQQEFTLGNAGKWIGILERLIIFVLVVFDQYAAIGLLTAAKSILRFSDTKDAPQRTEYVLIGTLISVATAITVGLLVKTGLQ
ncbi:DUF3307 domain-containing protein [Arcticibacter tournemirensis]|uniref:DUF3307 domain-containing protein n=2 Tax=Arcticibacter tournemirensis TaxID=699437 RepID=A0A4Q0MG74_9SPHI|nr:DUF3307 domain-containing protein [Arcticibacter tournemirensis]